MQRKKKEAQYKHLYNTEKILNGNYENMYDFIRIVCFTSLVLTTG